MHDVEFYKSWIEFTKAVGALDIKDEFKPEAADMDYLKEMGAHEALIKAAKYQYHCNEFNIAPGNDTREFAPDWMFKNSMTIGSDGYGNHAIWMDISRIDSPILFISHDPSEVVVLAKTPNDFFDNMRTYVSSQGISKNYGLIDGFLDINRPEPNTQSGIIHRSKPDKDIFDFNVANVGDAVPLDYRGKFTIVSKPKQAGILTLTTLSKDIIKKEKRRDLITWLVMAVVLILAFLFFYKFQKKSALTSITHTMFSFLAVGVCFSLSMDFHEWWQEKRKKK